MGQAGGSWIANLKMMEVRGFMPILTTLLGLMEAVVSGWLRRLDSLIQYPSD